MNIGNVRVNVIPEIDCMKVPYAMLIEGTVHREMEDKEGWSVPDYYDRGTQEIFLSVHSFLVDTGRHRILIDPCVGNHKPRGASGPFNMLNTPFLEKLGSTGVRPENVDFVFCTHLHADHCGWNTRLIDGRWVPTFPNARYLFSQRERGYWIAHDTPQTAGSDMLHQANIGVFADSVQPVLDAGQAVLLGDESHTIADCLTIEPGYGHTIGHLIGILRSRDVGALFSGDALHHQMQIYHPDWNSISSALPEEARRTRRRLLERCADEGLWLAGAHFMEPHMVKIARDGNDFRIA